MLQFPFLIRIHEGDAEKPRIFLRKHPVTIWGTSFLFLLLAAAPVAAAFLLPPEIAGWIEGPTLGPTIVLLLSLFELFALLLWYGAFMDWYLDIWVVTDERIVDVNQDGVFGRSTSELQLARVQDVTAEQRGVLATVFGYGTLRVESAGAQEHFVFQGIPHPHEVARHILELVQADQEYHRQALVQDMKANV